MPRTESYIYYTTDHKYWDQSFRHISQSIAAFLKLPTLFILSALRCTCLNENLINIPSPIMGSLYIPVLPRLFLRKRKANNATFCDADLPSLS